MTSPELLLSAVVSLADDPNSFELIGNDTVLQLSRQSGSQGFSDSASLLRLTGTAVRRLLAVGVTPLDLCHNLAQRLPQLAGVSLHDCDAVLLCHSHTNTATAECLAGEIAGLLHLRPDRVRGWNFGCSGFIQLLCEAADLFAQQPQFNRLALFNVETPETWHCSADRMFCGIVGAGATAVIVERANSRVPASSAASPRNPANSTGTGITAIHRDVLPITRLPGSPPLFHIEDCDGWTFRGQPCHRTVMRMNPEQVFVNAIDMMLATLRKALKHQPPQPGQQIVVLPHQPSGKLLRALAAAVKLEFPDCILLENLELQGNTISCTIPQLLADLPKVLLRNNIIPRPNTLFVAIGAGICMQRMHDQMSAGYAVFEANPQQILRG